MRLTSIALAGLPILGGLIQLATAQSSALPAAGEGAGLTGPSTSAEAAGYSCDATKCTGSNCRCASTSPPGGLSPSETPMFITWTSDDAVQVYTKNTLDFFLGNRRNPNACSVKSTYFVSINYTNHSMVTDMYVNGTEIADHTMTHVGDAPQNEIVGNLLALNAFSGIPISDIKGFRAPFLNFSINTLKLLAQAGFTYDSSMTASIPVDQPNTDAYWPYTLDYGVANNCIDVDGLCKGALKLPGFWEIPMYATFDNNASSYIGLMDPWLDTPDTNLVLSRMQETFTKHYNGNRAPCGIYSHPIHLALDYPGVTPLTAQINMISHFLDWAQQHDNVWIVTNQQLLAWVQNPVPISQLNSFAPLSCPAPQVDPSLKICNGIPQNEQGLLQNCAFDFFPWTTCYPCPTVEPSPSNPVPPSASPAAGQSLRYRLPSNCSTAFFDPIGNKCLCQSSSCAYTEQNRTIGPNGEGIVPSGGTGTNSSSPAVATQYKSFGGAARSAIVSVSSFSCVALALILLA